MRNRRQLPIGVALLAVIGQIVAAEQRRPNPGVAAAASCPGDVGVLRYDVKIALDLGTRTVTGHETVTFQARGGCAQKLGFPQNGLVIDGVDLGGRPTAFRIEGGQLIIPLPTGRTVDAGREAITIDYHGAPRHGLVFGDGFVYTDFFTCHWMVCHETSGERAVFGLELTVPSGYRVVASGREVETVAAGPDAVRSVWLQERGYAPYLYGFAAGSFTEASSSVGSTKLRLLGASETAEALRTKFKDTARMLGFFEQKAGVPLPHPCYTQVLVPGSQAQEKSTFSVIGTEELDPILSDPTEDWVIAHELSHQWWGNLITCKDWSHFWLNESLATFVVAAYKEERWGRAAYEREMTLARERHQAAVGAHFDVPLAYSKEYPSLRIKRAIVYSKGALFLDALRTQLGDQAFWTGVRDYTREYAGRTVVSRDFQAAMERATGKDLSKIFAQWVYE